MSLYEFTVFLDREPLDDELDRMYEAGLDDSAPEYGNGTCEVRVARHADSITAAIVTAVEDIERAGFDATGIQAEDLLTLGTIAERVGRSYESVRMLANGKRGPGGFPPSLIAGPRAFYSWDAVARWFREHYRLDVAQDDTARTIAAADHLLRARTLVDGPALAELARLTR